MNFYIDEQIKVIDKAICRHISNLNFEKRGAVSQDILAQLRNFVEHIMLKFYAGNNDISNTYSNICKAIEHSQTRGELKVLYRFHDFLQIVASHYALDEENSERLMLKYYEYLVKIKRLLNDRCSISVLENLNEFPLHTDPVLQEYYEKISEKIDAYPDLSAAKSDKYYVQKIKPFFVNEKVYYEVTFTPANDYANKFIRVIAFTNLEISENYAVKLSLIPDTIRILNKTMPIMVIVGWEVAIRECEYKNFSRIIRGDSSKIGYSEQQGLTRFLTTTGYSLTDLITFPNSVYQQVKQQATMRAKNIVFFGDLDKCRDIVLNNKPGCNVLRYLLYHMNNKIIKEQWSFVPNENLSNLCLKNGAIPFDKMPFISSPIGHNPRLADLFNCIGIKNRLHELLARMVRNNAEIKGQLFTPLSDIIGFDNIQQLVKTYNNQLWFGHYEESKLVIENGQIFINGYKEHTCYIINELKKKASSGLQNYKNSVQMWLDSPNHGVDCDEKKAALLNMFENSHVALIYGSAGTGKSTLINHISHFFADKSKLFLTQTHPAIDNLKRRVTASNCHFSTIASFIRKQNVVTAYDLIIIDECSTVSNRDMKSILSKATYKLLVLVGDTYQISSIRFGNWFSAARSFVPSSSVFELTTPYRTENEDLRTLWKRVREMDDRILELITRQGYSKTLDSSIFEHAKTDEIILCLNYDGLYGINNINRFLQENNPNMSVMWGIQQFKIGDPILFNESERFAPVIYNNMKGRIVDIEILDEATSSERIQFDIALDKVINGMDAWGQDFELLEEELDGNSIIRFSVNKIKSVDDDDNLTSDTVIPFQIAYAVSIHKAQGLEYDSVKIVITDEVDELITHNIFYTAITRARAKLKIYWTPEVENRVLTSIHPKDNGRDIVLLKHYLQ